MCEIYAFSGNRKRKLNHDLSEFYSHAAQHPNGWGLALFNKTNTEIYREAKQADRSETLKKLLERPIITQTALAHIRSATIGNVEIDNCHPFTATDISGRTWTLIHNGTVFEEDHLNEYIFQQKGETDSERILLYIIDRINESIRQSDHFPDAAKRFGILDELVCGSSPKNKLNLLIYDGEILYVHTNFRNSLYFHSYESGMVFSTQPLTENGWSNVTFTTLLGYKDGVLLYTGTNHGNEYFFDPSTYQPLYMAYSGL